MNPPLPPDPRRELEMLLASRFALIVIGDLPGAAAAPRFREPLQQKARRVGEELARFAARGRGARALRALALPPELVRKGRFDEIFFVDLPSRPARADILAIHTRKRGVELSAEELEALAAHSEGFSGAELEQAIVALYTSHSTKQPVSAALILHELRETRPLSVVMAEHVDALRGWARERTISAD